MEENEFGALAQAKTTPLTNPTIEMAKIMSNEFLKVHELQEYCRFVESDLKKYYKNLQKLTSAKNENAKMISEYKSRNKTNATNSESLLQALNELYKYKCELKSCYIAAQRAFKSKKLKYKKVISSYDSAWDRALKEYTSDPVVIQLQQIEQENALLEEEIERQEKLSACTKIQFIQVKESLEKNFLEKTVNFSEAMVQYTKFLKSTGQNKKNEAHQDPKRIFVFPFLKTEQPSFNRKESCGPENTDDANYASSVDMSIFDDVMVPSENLESQNLEDDAYFFGQNDERKLSTASKGHEEGLECLNNYQQTALLNCKTSVLCSKENSTQEDPKPATVNENESQYFRARTLESSKEIACENVQIVEQWNQSAKSTSKPKCNIDRNAEKLKAVGSTSQLIESEEEAAKNLQMESEESASEASYEKQFGNQRAENYECQYPKPSSVSSDELAGDNLNENPGPRPVFYEQNTDSKLGTQKKEKDIKPFMGFFTMGSDQDTSKPSIFKLF